MRAVRVVWMLCCLAVAALVWAEPTFPTLTGRVVDSANILDASTLSALETQLEAHEDETSNQIVVATVPSLQGYDISEFGVRLASHWQIGNAEDDNGVVLLVAPNERKVRIDVGYGLEGALPDALAGDIIRKRILPSFREDAYAEGVTNGVNSIIQAIQGEYEFDASKASKGGKEFLGILAPIAFMAIIFLSKFSEKRIKHYGVSRAIIPAGFAGLAGFAASHNALIALALLLGVFALVSLTVKPKNRTRSSHGGPNQNLRNMAEHDRMSGGFHGGGGGGFSGGGGGFGGGGASGGW